MAIAEREIVHEQTLSEQIRAWDDEAVMHTYSRLPIVLTRGSGARVWDTDGKQYLDFLGGIAVNGAGHCHPRVVRAIQQQAAQLIHTSNLYYTESQARLAKKLTEISDFERVFFCNSGAEANEAALKIARKYGKRAGSEKFKIVTAHRSFHGRTMATVTATAQPKYQEPFLPLIPGFSYVPFNDCDALANAIDDQTCAVLLEPIQGEGGIYPADKEYLLAARRLCDQHDTLLIFDEVQTGVGRTGKWWAYEHYDVIPDIMTSAKSLGGGFPIGACLARGEAATTLMPGDHGSTYAGNPLAASAALATLEAIDDEGMRENAQTVGAYLRQRLSSAEFPESITAVRGLGLMIGVQLREPIAKNVLMGAMSRGLLLNAIGDSILRFLPPLMITHSDVDEAVSVLQEAFYVGN